MISLENNNRWCERTLKHRINRFLEALVQEHQLPDISLHIIFFRSIELQGIGLILIYRTILIEYKSWMRSNNMGEHKLGRV